MSYLSVVWHFWPSLGLAILSIGMVVGLIFGYFRTVHRQKYPRR